MNNIENILVSIYGVGVVSAPVEAILWAVDRINDRKVAKAELKRANALRAKYGKPIAYDAYRYGVV